MRVWLDNYLIINTWWDQGATEHPVRRSVSGGEYTIKVEYFERGGDAVAQFRWERAPEPSNCDGGEGVYLYEHSNYQGRCQKFTEDSSNPRGWHIGNDTASSIRIVGQWTASLYEHDDYQGVSSTFTGSDADLGNDAIGHDRASSIQVTRGSGGGTRIYRLTARRSSKCLDVHGAPGSNGAPVIQWDCHGNANQQ